VSLQIRKLEKELKQPLVDRSRKRVLLTEAGKLLYADAKELLERIEDVKRLASHSVSQPEGELTIASNLSLINNFLPVYVAEFSRRYPKVKITFLNMTGIEIEKAILEGNAEVGLGFLVKAGPGIKAFKIAESGFVSVSKPKVQEELCIHFEVGVELREYIEKSLGAKRAFKVRMELPSIESILNYVRQGLGYSILPDFAVAGHWRKELAVKRTENIPPLVITAYIHKKRVLSKAGEKFLEILKSER